MPLLGAAALFVLWGLCRKLTTNKTQYTYNWGHAIDPLGWLYGAAVVASTAGVKALSLHRSNLWIFCFFGAGICVLVLISALTERAEDAKWEPKPLLKWVSLVLVLAILAAGLQVNESIAQELTQHGNSPQKPTPP